MGHVLIVDDDRSIREMLGAWLELEGFDTATLADGADAVAFLARADEPWVVLMDVMMPRLNGYETCRRLARMPGGERHRVALMTAAYTDEVDAPVQVRAVLQKPFDFDELIRVVESLAIEAAPFPRDVPQHTYGPRSAA